MRMALGGPVEDVAVAVEDSSAFDFDFSSREITPRDVGNFAARRSAAWTEEQVRSFYKQSSDRFPEHAPLAIKYAASHLDAGLFVEAAKGIVRTQNIGLSAGKTVQKVSQESKAPADFDGLLIALFRSDQASSMDADLLAGIWKNAEIWKKQPRGVRPEDRPIQPEILAKLHSAMPDDRGLESAHLVANGDVDHAIRVLFDLKSKFKSISYEEINQVICGLDRHLSSLVRSGWMPTFAQAIAAHEIRRLSPDSAEYILAASVLYLGSVPDALDYLNAPDLKGGRIIELAVRSIQEAARNNGSLTATVDDRLFHWERSTLLPRGERLDPVHAIIKPPVLACVEDAKVTRQLVISDNIVIVADNVFNPKSVYDGSMVDVSGYTKLVQYIEGDGAFFAGDYILVGDHDNFWHFLTNHLGKLAPVIGDSRFSEFNILFDRAPSDGNVEFLEALGFSRDNIVVNDRSNSRFERLWLSSIPYSESWVQEGLYVGRTAITPEAFDSVRSVLQGGTPTLGRRRLYLSRRDAIHRRVHNEDEVCGFLASRGFEIVEMSKLDLRAQCDLVRDAQLIVGVYGAQLTSAFFAPPGCHVVELCFERILSHVHYELPCRVLSLGYTKLPCELIGPAGPTAIHPHPSLHVPMDLLRTAVDRAAAVR